MTPDELMRDLRDIHLPGADPAVFGSGFVWWPLLVFALALGVLGFLTWRRRTAWRRQAEDALVNIEHAVADGRVLVAWRELARLVRQLALQRRADTAAASRSGEAWLLELDELFATKAFSEGSGRGLIHYPYVDRDKVKADHINDLVSVVRERIAKLKPTA